MRVTNGDSEPLATAVRRALGWRTWLVALGSWSAAALLTAASVRHAHGFAGDLSRFIVAQFGAWAPYAVMTPLVLAFDAWCVHRFRRFPLQLAALVPGCLGFVAVHHVTTGGAGGHGAWPWSALVYVHLILVSRALRHRRLLRSRELQTAELRSQLAEARISGLQSQLQPHFLFNTLNAIAVTIEADPKRARRMIARLADLLRSTLRLTDPLIPLEQDVETLDAYVELQSMRFGDRLRVEIDIPAGLEQRLVPTLLLQPLVENAIRHGIEPRVEGGAVTVRAGERGGALVIDVKDDGVGLEQTPPREGTGLRAVRERLTTLYAGEAEFSIGPLEPHGTHVRVEIPPERAA